MNQDLPNSEEQSENIPTFDVKSDRILRIETQIFKYLIQYYPIDTVKDIIDEVMSGDFTMRGPEIAAFIETHRIMTSICSLNAKQNAEFLSLFWYSAFWAKTIEAEAATLPAAFVHLSSKIMGAIDSAITDGIDVFMS